MDSALTSFICCAVIVGFTSLPANTHSPDISSGAYFGCFRDIGQYAAFTKRVNATRREPDSCRKLCRNESSTYIGLWGGGNCWCANTLTEGTALNRTSSSGVLEKVNDSLCNASCADNSTLSCGGFKDEADNNIYSVYSVCQKTKYGKGRCKQSCNCKDDNHCTVEGVCPNTECAPGWKLNVTTTINRAICNNDVDECQMECNSTHTLDCQDCSLRSNERCNNTKGGYKCICKTGFRNSTEGCKDINECQNRKTHNCSHECNNYEGGFNCSCRPGYKLEGFSNCSDIDECQNATTHKCNQTCHNTDGSYSCSCLQGFTLDANTFHCNDVDECSTNTSNCQHICNNTYGGYICHCENGYELTNDKYTCKDVDECELKTASCDQMCNNTNGSYICSCHSGFSLDQNDRRKCNDVDECQTNKGNCDHNCTNTNGSYFCSCLSGYQLHNDSHACEDINECTNYNGNCSQQCNNSIGSYNCSCYEGYELDSDHRSCKDVDECSRNISKCNQNCTNTIGSYNCSCFSGFKHKDEHICIDVNECEINKGGCQHYCNNTPGSFSCSCQPGFRSTGDSMNETTGYNCTDIDECSERTSNCEHNCNNTIGNYTCSCHSGFHLQDNGFNCNDTDECLSVPSAHRCSHVCINLIGNYSCSCHHGHYLVGVYDCEKDSTQAIIISVIILLLIIIIVMVLFLLKMRKIFPFDKPRFTKLFGQTNGPEAPYENGTSELKELIDTKPHPDNQEKQKSSPAANGDQKKKMVRKTLVAVKDLKNYVEKIESGEGFEDEFRSIEMVSDFPFGEAQAQALKPKNRFKNILPYDHNRVILSEVNDDPLTTYINASFIKGYKIQDKIIASHGPTPSTLNDFWRMIWQYDVSVIVMVTKCMEDGKCKCEQYWPLDGSTESGDLTIALDSIEKWPDYIISHLKVSKENSARSVVHLLFTDWPDHGVPDHATSLISFRRAVRSFIVENRYFLVHCSAGVGRTGTFLAIDYLLQQAEAESSIDIYRYLQGLRDQRMNAVQTPDQYEFIHHALLETLTLGRTTFPCSTFSDYRDYLQKINPMTGKSYFQTQFDMLQDMHPALSPELTSVALEKNNISRNRNEKILPGDRNRVYVTDSSEGSDYINAVFVSSYRRKDSFISTELPLPDTINQFWQMTLSYRCKLIVFLDTSNTSEDLNKYLLIPQKKKLTIDGHKFWTTSTEPRKISDECDSHSVAVSLPLDEEDEIYANAEEVPAFKILILHFRLTSATASSLLPQIHEQIKLSSENIKDNGPVVIVSRDGVYPSGPLIAVSNLLEMSLSQQEMDVFSAVHSVKNTQPLFITTADEFQTIYDAIAQVESDFTTYANY